MNKPPSIGQIITARGQQCQVVRVHPFGTVDVSNVITGKSFRVTGLSFISDKAECSSQEKAYATTIDSLIRNGQLIEVLDVPRDAGSH